MEVDYTKKLRAGELLQEAKKVFFANKELFKDLFLFFFLPYAIVSTFGKHISGSFGGAAVVFILSIVTIILMIKGNLIVFISSFKLLSSENISLEEAKAEAKKKFWPYLGAMIVLGLAVFGLSLLFIIPGIIFSVFWIFYPALVAIKGKDIGEAMSDSKKLVKGRWWNVVGYLFIFSLFSFALMLPGIIILSAVTAMSGLGVLSISPIVLSIIELVVIVYCYVVSLYMSVVNVALFKNWDTVFGEKPKASSTKSAPSTQEDVPAPSSDDMEKPAL